MTSMAEPEPTRTEPKKGANARLIMLMAAVGALLILVASALLNWPNRNSIGGSGRIGPAPAPRVVFEAEAGDCLNWNEPDATDIRKVDCGQPHLFEVTGTFDLRPQLPDDAPFHSTEQWQQLKQEHCTAVSQRYLDGMLDPDGRFSVGAFTPSEEGWADGDRTLHCGIQQPGPSGKLYRIKGSIRNLDQSNTYEAGRCLGINGTQVWDPVDCSEPHSVEITGLVDLGDEFTGDYPAPEDQDEFLATRCDELSADYAGGPDVVRDKELVVYWDTLSEESWKAGSRNVNCKVGAPLPDGSGLAPVTGSVRGEVQIGDEPAPSDTTSPEPGVPADEPR